MSQGIEEITKGTGTHKHTETELRYFNWHGRLPIEEDSRASWNISIQFPCVCVCLSLLWSLQFLVRVFTFLSLNLWFLYFGTFLSTWSVLPFLFNINIILYYKYYKLTLVLKYLYLLNEFTKCCFFAEV